MDQITFGSFPRSGNHFCETLFNTYLPHCKINYQGHRLKALNDFDNVVVTLRNPSECIPSWIVFRNDYRPDAEKIILDWYYDYYSNVLQQGFLILNFKNLINNPLDSINKMCKKLNIQGTKNPYVEFDFSTGFHSPTLNKNRFVNILEKINRSSYANKVNTLYQKCLLKAI